MMSYMISYMTLIDKSFQAKDLPARHEPGRWMAEAKATEAVPQMHGLCHCGWKRVVQGKTLSSLCWQKGSISSVLPLFHHSAPQPAVLRILLLNLPFCALCSWTCSFSFVISSPPRWGIWGCSCKCLCMILYYDIIVWYHIIYMISYHDIITW